MENLTEREWGLLLQRIEGGKCTPIIGPSVSADLDLPRAEIAQSWAYEHDYPLADATDMARVAQYLAVQFDPFYPKEKLREQLEEHTTPDYSREDQPHSLLADLDLPIYLTTNFDDYMMAALQHRRREPRREIYRWNEALRRGHPSHLEAGFEPTVATPLVYHLYGHYEHLETMVLTEDDYLDFLINASSVEYQLPHRIQRALANTSLLLIGYNPLDWNFRALFRGLRAAAETNLRRISVTVQLPPVPDDAPAAVATKTQEYLSSYFDNADRRMRVYWGSVEEFIVELHRRWQGQKIAEAPRPTEGEGPAVNLSRLLDNMLEYFSKSDLHTLAFRLSVDYELFPEPKDAFTRELIVYLQKRKRLYELLTICREERSEVEW